MSLTERSLQQLEGVEALGVFGSLVVVFATVLQLASPEVLL